MATDPRATHTASVTEVDFRSGQAVRHDDTEDFVPAATGRDLQLAARYDDYAWQTAAMETPPPRGRWLQIGVTAVAVIGFFVMVWFAYQWGLERGYREEVPVIRAEAGPVKVKPDNPGGLVVPNQDKLVLNQGAGAPEPAGVERLLSAPETPQPVPQPETAPALAAADAEGTANEPTLRLQSVESAAPSAAAGQTAETQAAAEPTPPPEVAPAAGGTAAADAGGSESATATPDVGGGGGAAAPAKLQLAAVEDGDFVIQLASVTSDEAAKTEWARLRKSFPDLLGDMNLAVQRATVKGTEYHRVQTGPFPSRATALDMCAQLKAQNQPCIVQQR